MEDRIFPDLEGEGLIEMLKNNCQKVDFAPVRTYFTPEELIDMKESISETSIIKNDLEEELAKISKDLRTQIKFHQGELKQVLKDVKKGYVEQDEEVYVMHDHSINKALVYNKRGELISSRKLHINERQHSIFELNQKTA